MGFCYVRCTKAISINAGGPEGYALRFEALMRVIRGNKRDTLNKDEPDDDLPPL
jgi:hypothetical protein